MLIGAVALLAAALGGSTVLVLALLLNASAMLGRTCLLKWPDWVLMGGTLLLLHYRRWPPALLLGGGALAGYTGLVR